MFLVLLDSTLISKGYYQQRKEDLPLDRPAANQGNDLFQSDNQASINRRAKTVCIRVGTTMECTVVAVKP